MATPVPLPTFPPQDEWYRLTVGQLNPSFFGTVPNYTFLHPSVDVNNQQIDGIIGGLDGGVLLVIGAAHQIDGGQGFYMWSTLSMAVDNPPLVFNPYVVTDTPGRWLLVPFGGGGGGGGGGPVISEQIITNTSPAVSPGVFQLAVAVTPFVEVISRYTLGNATLLLPLTMPTPQKWGIKDDTGVTSGATITVNGNGLLIDGQATQTFGNDEVGWGYMGVMWNGAEWNVQ
jgi:hypothetical protein